MFKRINRNIQAFAVGVCIAATGILIADDASAADFQPLFKVDRGVIYVDLDSIEQISANTWAFMSAGVYDATKDADIHPVVVDCKKQTVELGPGKRINLANESIVAQHVRGKQLEVKPNTFAWEVLGIICGKPA